MIAVKNDYKVGLYTRISLDDGTNEESVSIDTQKKILTDYVTKQGWQIAKVYVDDGYSGGNFDRPDFKRMIQDIENKEIDCVITKDLSRLGRNYIDCGFYLEIYFPEHQVRYIAVNDGIDNISSQSMDITPFKNILNEMYVKDISVKVSSARKVRAQNGKYMATLPPYGYLKDELDKNHLVIDPETAPVVKLIYDLYYSGKGTNFISNYLEKKEILRPYEYFRSKGLLKNNRTLNKSCYYWSNKTILDILSSPTYTGAVVGGKTKKVSPKSKKKLNMPKEDWIIVPDMHEPIIDKELFENVQKMRSQNKIRYRAKINEDRFNNIFKMIIRCPKDRNLVCKVVYHNGDCKSIENRKYCCNDKCPHKDNCKTVYIRAERLYNIVLADINQYTNDFCSDKENYNILEKRLEELNVKNTKMYENEKIKIQNRLVQLNELITSSYEDKIFKRITEDLFNMMNAKFKKEQDELNNKLNSINENILEIKRDNQNAVNFAQLLKEFNGTSELSLSTITNLVDKVIVYPSDIIEDENGEKVRTQKIEIVYRYVGCLAPTTIQYDDLNYKTRYKDRVCKLCGNVFTPTTSRQKYCVGCKAEADRIRHKEHYKKKVQAKGGNTGYREKECQICGNLYKPNSSGQKYCPNCQKIGSDMLKRKWYLKKKQIYQEKKKVKQAEKKSA